MFHFDFIKSPTVLKPQGMFLHFYLRPILKGKTDIFFIKNCDKINQAVPLLFIEFRGHAVLPF